MPALQDITDLSGRVAIVTGGNGGIGLGMALGLASPGAHVVVAARNAEKSARAVQEIQELGVDALAVSTDVTSEDQVNAVLPGWIATDLTAPIVRQFPDWHREITSRIPAGRWGEPSDLAGVALFLASSASDYVTGAVITVDGGYSVR